MEVRFFFKKKQWKKELSVKKGDQPGWQSDKMMQAAKWPVSDIFIVHPVYGMLSKLSINTAAEIRMCALVSTFVCVCVSRRCHKVSWDMRDFCQQAQRGCVKTSLLKNQTCVLKASSTNEFDGGVTAAWAHMHSYTCQHTKTAHWYKHRAHLLKARAAALQTAVCWRTRSEKTLSYVSCLCYYTFMGTQTPELNLKIIKCTWNAVSVNKTT